MGVSSNRVEDFSSHHETSVRMSPASAEAVMVVAMPPVEIHRVCLPPSKTTFQKLRQRLSEIFFPDDPLHRFKNQSSFTKLVLALQFFFPIFHWAPTYSLALLRSDIISGLTIASLAIPQVSHNPQPINHIYICVCVCVDLSKEWTVCLVMFFFIFRLKITSTIDGYPFQLCSSDFSCLKDTDCRLFYKFLVICCRELVMQSLQICRPLLDYVSIAIFLILSLLMVLLIDWLHTFL